jgi:hypothetical protein
VQGKHQLTQCQNERTKKKKKTQKESRDEALRLGHRSFRTLIFTRRREYQVKVNFSWGKGVGTLKNETCQKETETMCVKKKWCCIFLFPVAVASSVNRMHPHNLRSLKKCPKMSVVFVYFLDER